MLKVELLTTRDLSSGRYHHRYRVEDRLLVDERCNLDQAGAYEIVQGHLGNGPFAGIPLGTNLDLLCKWCFPLAKVPDQPDADTSG